MKNVLEIDNPIDFSLLGISCHAKDYRLSWEINKTLTLELEKDESLYSMDLKNEFGFSTATFSCVETHLVYMLISNKNEGGHLITEYPQLDYFIRISGPMHEMELKNCKEKLYDIKSVLTVVELNPHNLKSKMNLVF